MSFPLSALALYPAAIPAHHYASRPSSLSPSLLLSVLHTPRTLGAFVGFTDWSDLHALLSTCSSLRSSLFAHVPTRDIVLSRFVPGFSFCLKHRDLQFYQDVPITIHDLDLLLISQRTDLHRYPTHALRTLTAPALSNPSHTHTTTKLIKLTQAHSRFVLLFQSLVHSSPLPILPDPPEDKSGLKSQDPSPQLTFPPPLAFINDPPPLPPKDSPKLYKSRKKHKPSYSFSHRSISRKHSASPYMVSPSNLTHSPLSNPNDPSTDPKPSSKSLPSRNNKLPNRCLSLFCLSEPTPPPPPPEDPETLRIRSKEWRRARSASILSPTGSLAARRPPLSSLNGRLRGYNYSALDFDIDSSYPSDTEFEFGQLRRPIRLFASEGNNNNLASSSSSSISISETRSSWNQGQGSTTSSRSSPPVSPHGYTHRFPYHPHLSRNGYGNNNGTNPPFAPSIHSLIHATIRNRAPIIRVFVPTQHMHSPTQDPSPQTSSNSSPERTLNSEKSLQQQSSPQTLSSLAIQACESQLQEAGLWDHLSTGDVICNFGYIPLDDDPSSSLDIVPPPPGLVPESVYTPKVLSPSHRPSLRSFSNLQSPFPPAQQLRKTWLIFTGHSLLPYTPPSLLPLPSSSPLSLPSPFYYYHILPAGTNPLFEIPQLPPPAAPSGISLTLIKTTSLIPSTISHTGFAKVNKFAWTGRVVHTRPAVPFPSVIHPPHPPMSNKNPFATLVQTKPLPPPPQPTLPLNPNEQLGDGWIGEWIVEYEGTSEGREVLLAALEGKVLGKKKEGEEVAKRVWEVRRERSGGGRVWMRLLPE